MRQIKARSPKNENNTRNTKNIYKSSRNAVVRHHRFVCGKLSIRKLIFIVN